MRVPPPYVVKQPYTFRRILRDAGSNAAGFIIVGALIVPSWLGGAPLFFAVADTLVFGAILIYLVVDAVRPGTLIEVARSGMTVGSAYVPWAGIRQVVIMVHPPRAAGPPEVEVGLRVPPNIPLPSGAKSLITNPDDPDEIPSVLRVVVPSRSFSPDELRRTAHNFSPSHVQVVEARDTAERVIG